MPKWTILFLILTLLIACELKRSNPLDPAGGKVQEPPQVTAPKVHAYTSGTVHWVHIGWTGVGEADGYYVYRALSLDGKYDLLTDSGIPDADTLYYRDYEVFSNNYYYYKVSAYKNYPDYSNQPLEGTPSNAVSVFVE
jgi:hypothetical protein